MKKLALSFLSLFILISFSSTSQDYAKKNTLSGSLFGETHETDSYGTSANGRLEDNLVSGHQTGMYLEDSWTDGYAMLRDNSVMEDIILRYNIYFGQMQFIKDGDTLAFGNPAELDHIGIGNHTFIYTSYTEQDILGEDYFEVLVDGDCQLLKRRMVKYHMNHDPVLDEEGDGSFVQCCGLYIKTKDDPAKKMICTKKGVKCCFKDQEEAITNFIKTNKLSVKKQDDMAQIVAFYNTLI